MSPARFTPFWVYDSTLIPCILVIFVLTIPFTLRVASAYVKFCTVFTFVLHELLVVQDILHMLRYVLPHNYSI